jgi:hypothetical protein
MIRGSFENLKCAKDLPASHAFGVTTKMEEGTFKQIIQFDYKTTKQQENFENVEQSYKPQEAKHNLKPPKPTNAHIQRTQAAKRKF